MVTVGGRREKEMGETWEVGDGGQGFTWMVIVLERARQSGMEGSDEVRSRDELLLFGR